MDKNEAEIARLHHLQFMKTCWMGSDDLIVGFHTRKICARLDKAFTDFENGISTYLLISVHPRAGKSDIISRYAGPHFLGEFPSKEVLQASYQADIAAGFSAFGRNVVRSDVYKELYPNVKLSDESNRKNDWLLVSGKGKPTGGKLYASGLQSGLTSQGFHFGVLDDYCAGRAQAESKAYRESSWGAFKDDFMTRRAPVHIVVVTATQWHIDDITGRIIKETESNPDFPQFERLCFPARAKDYRGEGKYPTEFLFEERMGKKWYLSQYATLGPYSSAALMDCDPVVRTGGRLSVEFIEYVDSMPEVHFSRIWDLAHTAKQRKGDDPDWTSGTKLSFQMEGEDPIPHLYVAHVFRNREGAKVRDCAIEAIVRSDSVFVSQYVENSLDNKDAYEYITNRMPEFSWNKLILPGDKAVRATPLETIFATPGHVHVQRGDWNNDWVNEIMMFDGTGKEHDDQVDNLSAGYAVYIGELTVFDNGSVSALKSRRSKR